MGVWKRSDVDVFLAAVGSACGPYVRGWARSRPAQQRLFMLLIPLGPYPVALAPYLTPSVLIKEGPLFMLLEFCCRCSGATLTKRHVQMPARVQTLDTWVVLQNLLICVVSFYSVYYIIVSLCIGFLRVEDTDALLAPFDYKIQPSWQNPKYLVSVISTEVTYILAGLLFAWIVEECVWDYAITITLVHVGLTCAVMSDFPSSEHWWGALGSGLVLMIFAGQLFAYWLFRNNFVHPTNLQNF